MHPALLLVSITLTISHESIVGGLIQPCEHFDALHGGIAVTGSSTDPAAIVMRYRSRGLFESRDQGASWTPITSPRMCMLQVEGFFNPQPAAGEPWCLGTINEESSQRIFCSKDQGGLFERLPYQMPTRFSRIKSFLVDPSKPRNMVMHISRPVGGDLLFRSKDGGANWHTWSFPGIENDNVYLHATLADGAILAEVVEGRARRRGRAKLVRYKPGAPGKFETVKGPWKKGLQPLIDVDPTHPQHWIATIYTKSGSRYAYESFDDGGSFKSLGGDNVRIYEPVFLQDEGLAYRGIEGDNIGRAVVFLRHGRDGDFAAIDLPELSDRLRAAANTLFVDTMDDVYRLDESTGNSKAAWRRIDREITP